MFVFVVWRLESMSSNPKKKEIRDLKLYEVRDSLHIGYLIFILYYLFIKLYILFGYFFNETYEIFTLLLKSFSFF